MTIKFPAVRTAADLEPFEQSFSISFDANELRAAIFHISDAYRSLADSVGRLRKALTLAEDALSRSPFSTQIWPNGTHPNAGIELIRAALSDGDAA